MKKIALSIVVLFSAATIAIAQDAPKKACCKKGDSKECAKKDEKACAGKDAKACTKGKSCCKSKAAQGEVKMEPATTPAAK